jgi:hypothetical protein
MNSHGESFPTVGTNEGHIHLDTVGGGEYRYLGGDITDTVANWLLVGGRLVTNPDTSAWGTRQNGARWFNTTDGAFYGWNGAAIIYIG